MNETVVTMIAKYLVNKEYYKTAKKLLLESGVEPKKSVG